MRHSQGDFLKERNKTANRRSGQYSSRRSDWGEIVIPRFFFALRRGNNPQDPHFCFNRAISSSLNAEKPGVRIGHAGASGKTARNDR